MIKIALVVVAAGRLDHDAAAHYPAKKLLELFDAHADFGFGGRDWIQVAERDLEWQLHEGSPLSRDFQDDFRWFVATVAPLTWDEESGHPAWSPMTSVVQG